MVDPSQNMDGIAGVLISDGRIEAIVRDQGLRHIPGGDFTLEADGLIVTPGFVDLHAHLRYPGLPDEETIASGTSAAIRGGFTTVCAMANSSPPVDSPAQLDKVLEMVATEARCHVKVIGAASVGLAGRILADVGAMVRTGAVALSDDGNPIADAALMERALRASDHFGVPLAAHEEIRNGTRSGAPNPHWPCPGETAMIRRDLDLVRKAGGRLHVTHVSCESSLELIAAAQAEGLPVTAEVTPHHMFLSEGTLLGGESLPPAHGTAKVNPPLRSLRDLEAVRAAVSDGTAGAIATDHAPHCFVDKLGGASGASFGLTGFETALPIVLDLVAQAKLGLSDAIARLTTGPATAFGLNAGTLRVGLPADLCLIDPTATWQASRDSLVSKGKNTPLRGRPLKGRVRAVVVAGRLHTFETDHELRALRAS